MGFFYDRESTLEDIGRDWIPACAGMTDGVEKNWIPAFAGMTVGEGMTDRKRIGLDTGLRRYDGVPENV